MSLIGLLWIFANLVPICVKSQAAENEAYVVELFTGTKLVLEPDLELEKLVSRPECLSLFFQFCAC